MLMCHHDNPERNNDIVKVFRTDQSQLDKIESLSFKWNIKMYASKSFPIGAVSLKKTAAFLLRMNYSRNSN